MKTGFFYDDILNPNVSLMLRLFCSRWWFCRLVV